MTNLISVEHIGTNYVRLDFDGPMRNDSTLRAPAAYTIGGLLNVLSVTVPYAQAQPYVAPANPGGAPRSVYLECDVDVSTLGGVVAVVVNPLVWDYSGNPLVIGTQNVTTIVSDTNNFWEYDGLRITEAKKEFAKTGARYKSKTKTPNNYGLVTMIGKMADMVSGGHISKIETYIDGPLTGKDALPVQALTPGGFSPPKPSVPGLGDTITFTDGEIPAHVDKLWGACDGTNTIFRSSIFFHPHTCVILYVPPSGSSEVGGVLDASEWFSPLAGRDRLIRMKEAPSEGASLLAVYVPRKSLLRIDQEIIAYDNSDFTAGTAEIVGREQLSTTFQEHNIGAVVEDVWATSFVGRALYNLLCWGASGTALENRANDLSVSKTDNQFFIDVDLRRAVFNTSVNLRGTPGTFDQAMRYIYPHLWRHIIYGEDPRWPGCVTVWFSTDVIGDTSWGSEPQVEPWETWLDHIAWLDGIETDLLYETYYRNPIGDISYFGDFFLTNGLENPAIAPYPVVVGSVPITVMGYPAPIIPPPSTVSAEYKNYIRRPYGLERALPCGVGVLILDFGYIT